MTRTRHLLATRGEQRWLQKIQLWAAARPDCLWLDRVEPYTNCRVAGVVRRLRLDPQAETIEVTITDGWSSLLASWQLQRPWPQLGAGPGQGLILEGVARVDPSGNLLFVEPDYKISPGPELDW